MDPISIIGSVFSIFKGIHSELATRSSIPVYLSELNSYIQNIEQIIGKLDDKTKEGMEVVTLREMVETARAIKDLLFKGRQGNFLKRAFVDPLIGTASKQKEAILELHSALRDKLTALQLDVQVAGQQNLLQQIHNLQNVAPEQSQNPVAWKLDESEITVSNSLLGAGGFASTYAGEYRGLPVAVKLPHPHVLQTYHRTARIREREVSILFKLHHPNIVACLGGLGSDASKFQFGVIMEKLSQTLEQAIIEPSSALQRSTLARMQTCLAVCRGVTFLHSQTPYPMLHRDINPRNVMFDDHGTAKLIDFGNAKELVPGAAHSTQVVATPGWVAQEVEDGFSEHTVKSDVYALGLVCFVSATCRGLDRFLPVHSNQPAIANVMERACLPSDTTGKVLEAIFNRPLKRPKAAELTAFFQSIVDELSIPTPTNHSFGDSAPYWPTAPSTPVPSSPKVGKVLEEHLNLYEISSLGAGLASDGFLRPEDLMMLEEAHVAQLMNRLSINFCDQIKFKKMLETLKGKDTKAAEDARLKAAEDERRMAEAAERQKAAKAAEDARLKAAEDARRTAEAAERQKAAKAAEDARFKAEAAGRHAAGQVPKNDEGRPVRPGSNVAYPGYLDADKLYCGGPNTSAGSDGRCGPTAGPPCQSCKRLTNSESGKKLLQVMDAGRVLKGLAAKPRNDAGFLVGLGNDQKHPGFKGSDKFYCGVRARISGSDGMCGPSAGPQCSSCTRFTASQIGKSLLPGLVWYNSKNRVAMVGENVSYPGYVGSDKLYCGGPAGGNTDGRCGPSAGDQCQACADLTAQAWASART